MHEDAHEEGVWGRVWLVNGGGIDRLIQQQSPPCQRTRAVTCRVTGFLMVELGDCLTVIC